MLQKREDGVYYVVDDLAEYPGGHDTMIAFISRNGLLEVVWGLVTVLILMRNLNEC